jgi:hypothetical protein
LWTCCPHPQPLSLRERGEAMGMCGCEIWTILHGKCGKK